jgi:hypothetical protein
VSVKSRVAISSFRVMLGVFLMVLHVLVSCVVVILWLFLL